MGTWYDVEVEIEGYDSEKKEAIQQALLRFAPFEDWDEFGGPDKTIVARAGANYSGMLPEDIATNIAKLVWTFNEDRCYVLVRVYHTELTPCDEYAFA